MKCRAFCDSKPCLLCFHFWHTSCASSLASFLDVERLASKVSLEACASSMLSFPPWILVYLQEETSVTASPSSANPNAAARRTARQPIKLCYSWSMLSSSDIRSQSGLHTFWHTFTEEDSCTLPTLRSGCWMAAGQDRFSALVTGC